MRTIKIHALAFFTASLWIVPSIATADLASLLGLDKLGERGLKEAAEAGRQAADAAIKASRNVTMTTNQFGLVLSDYYGSDAQKKADAQRLIEGAFGVKIADFQGKFEIEVTTIFSKLNSGETVRADLLFLDVESDSGIQAILKTSTAFKSETINKSVPSTPAVDQLRKQVAAMIETRKNGKGCPAPIFGGTSGFPPTISVVNQKEIDDCKIVVEDKLLTDAIMLGSSYQIELPIINSFSRRFTGGKYAVLVIPKDELEKVKDHLEIDIIMNQVGDTSKRFTVFQTPLRVDNNFMSEHIAATDNSAYKNFSYYFIDLKLEGHFVVAQAK